jgi:hypothetical protein
LRHADQQNQVTILFARTARRTLEYVMADPELR